MLCLAVDGYAFGEAQQDERLSEKGSKQINADELIQTALSNMDNLNKYYQEMPDTQFVFFCSPFSILFWDKNNQNNGLDVWRETYLTVIGDLVKHQNVSVYFWNDQEMLDTICNLDYYTDEAHYNVEVCKMICNRISINQGLMNQSNYQDSVNQFFDYLKLYDYDAIFA